VEYALQGHSDYMVGLQRAPGAAYTCTTCMVPLQQAANAEACVPAHFINEAGNFVTDAFLDYVRPLVQGEARPPYEDGLPRFARLKLQRI